METRVIPYAEPGTDKELQDTTTSPLKNNDVLMSEKEASNLGAKRRLLLEDKDILQKETEEDVDGALAMVTSSSLSPELHVGNDGISARTKTSKKAGDDSTSLGSTGSLEGSVRSQ